MAEKLRFGVIGAGGIALRRTIPGMLLAPSVQVTAVMDPNKDCALEAQKLSKAKYCFTSAGDLLACPDVDAVYIASPVQFHAEQAMASAKAHKHILLEKPIALSAAEAKTVLDYCKTQNVMIAAGLMMRFGTNIQAMRRAVLDGQIGQVISCFSQFTAYLPPSSGNWRLSKAKSGGGCLVDMAVHTIDLLEYVTGQKVTEVAAMNDTLSFDYEVEDSSTVLLRLEKGAQCVVKTNFNIPDEAADWRFDVYGSRGKLCGVNVIGQEDGGTCESLFLSSDTGYDPMQQHEVHASVLKVGEFGNLYAREMESFAQSVLNGTLLVAPASQALHVQEVMEAAYQSSQTRHFVQVNG